MHEADALGLHFFFAEQSEKFPCPMSGKNEKVSSPVFQQEFDLEPRGERRALVMARSTARPIRACPAGS